MKKIGCLTQLIDVNDQELIASFSKNTSILKLFATKDGGPHGPFAAMVKRNNDMWRVHRLLLGTTTSKTTAINAATSNIPPPIPHSPAFMMLQARLAGWPESNIITSSNNKRK
jgi:hypothetical protein